MRNLTIIELLKQSPWPLTISDIAQVLDVDEMTAAQALRLLRQHNRASLDASGTGWIVV